MGEPKIKNWTEMTVEDIEVRRDCDYQSGGDLAWRYMQAWRDVDFLLAALREALATIEAMSGDAADLHDLIGEAAAMRTVLGHLLGPTGRIHDSGCGICDAGRALLTSEHELPSLAASQDGGKPG